MPTYTPRPLVFPNEILLHIFRIAFDECRELKQELTPILPSSNVVDVNALDETQDTRNSEYWRWTFDEIGVSPTLFPFPQADTCRQWRQVLAADPAYWTRLVIFLDDVDASSTYLRDYISWSRDELIHVRIAYRNRPAEQSHVGSIAENARIELIMRELAPHIHRCKSIRLDLTYRSSVLAAARHLHGGAPHLQILALDSSITDTAASIVGLEDLSCPKLRHLHIDAKSLVDVREANVSWLHQLQHPYCTLVASSYQPPDPRDAVSLYDFLRCITGSIQPNLRFLAVRSVAFQETDRSSIPYISHRGQLMIHLVDLEGFAVPILLQFASSSATVTRCGVAGLCHWWEGVSTLTVNSVCGHDLIKLLHRYQGFELVLRHCTCLDDDFFRVFGGENRYHFYLAGKTHRLSLIDCSFSVAAMQRALTERAEVKDMSPELINAVGSADLPNYIDNLSIYQPRTVLTDEEKVWFGQHIDRNFEYSEEPEEDDEEDMWAILSVPEDALFQDDMFYSFQLPPVKYLGFRVYRSQSSTEPLDETQPDQTAGPQYGRVWQKLQMMISFTPSIQVVEFLTIDRRHKEGIEAVPPELAGRLQFRYVYQD
ncbi:hypothetical protein CONPUDRAFT_164283 [Coniophora puteana RWD-64-598 SS2]|uniref:F-box domain-containing protein n=1 Tax=Coniophora puteana (strain RWD-64-598) TaxID=741705 RepID=A0A5M3MXG6_CONPW|nr:uncharacterized protein CONPUDRAFT_164283 [Coniophora puteana RWD-64-598 SS2]EIW83321.1 hypothetical protein CONPUDRAFT_164283 [Coniophora puteana RWD-64-598 SS2]